MLILDQADSLSFDAASVAVKNGKTGDVERVDLPMRASAGGYYANLMQMYTHLSIPLHPVRFLFVFAEALSRTQRSPVPTANGVAASKANPRPKPDAESDTTGGALRRYFIHASNLHQTPPPWPGNRGVIPHIVEVMYLLVCHFWFSIACFAILPITTSAKGSSSEGGETFAEYLDRIWLPRRYTSQYLLPLMSSVCTCTHDELLAFPASDIVNYKKLSHGQQHYAVCGGVNQVQTRLSERMDHVRLGARVLEVRPNANRGYVSIRWQSTKDNSGRISEELFDRVVLAVSPDVAGKIFKPMETVAHSIPTVQVESSVLAPAVAKDEARTFSVIEGSEHAASGCMHHTKDGSHAQTITFKTKFSGKAPRTEALHAMPGGVVVSTCPLDPHTSPKTILQHAKFTRTLRTPESRVAVERIMGRMEPDEKTSGQDEEWVNGDDNVWLAGAWCWDGMVLLEGCIVSAMQVADDFGVGIPWRTSI